MENCICSAAGGNAPSKVRKLNVAFLGGAYASAVGRVHRIAVEMDQRFELIAGCFSRNARTSKDSALKYGIDPDRSYHRLEHLLAGEAGRLDAVVVLTPQDQHGEHVLACLEAGVPVICEKALVASAREAVAIRDRVASRAGFLAVTYNYTGYPMLRELKRMVEVGRFGKIQQVHIEMPQEGFARLDADGAPIVPQEWRLRDGVVPTLSLDLGVHLHMIVRFLTSQSAEEVVAISSSFGNFRQVTDNISCLAHYSGDLVCSIWYSKTAFGCRNGLRVRLFGEKGAAEWVQEDPEYLHVAYSSGTRIIVDRTYQDIEVANQARYQRFKAGHPAGFIEAFANYYYDVADVLERFLDGDKSFRNDYVFGVEESLEGLRMLESIARSSASKNWERVA